MNIGEIVARAPEHVGVLIFEDDLAAARSVERAIHAVGVERVDIAMNLRDFSGYLDSAPVYQALSIDWLNGTFAEGRAALSAADQAPAGRVIYTHGDATGAMNLGADIVIYKDNIDELQTAIVEATKVGFARQLIREVELKDVPVALPLSEEVEEVICRASLHAAVERYRDGNGDILDILRNRGWLTLEDPFAFLRRSSEQRLQCLLEMAEIDVAAVADILRCSPPMAEAVRTGRRIEGNEFAAALDGLVSVLHYTLRLAGMYRELLWSYARSPRLFKRNDAAPPWNESGLLHYLTGGVDSISQALIWIRNN
jgi:hypothetical protein